jgi:DNA mismatch repair protein MutL
MSEPKDHRRVERLSDDLVNKIAAGEVVERPASVVKELIENALDAGARQITVEIEGGGRSLVRVRDDGCGMDREDARLSVERHATSKLRALEDLAAVATHGFRGEALPSIASVSHLVLRTRPEDAPAGTEVAVVHGRLDDVRDCGHPRGTTVEVRDLFGAVPARRKFLRADSTETSHVAEVVTLAALAHPEVGFSLASATRSLVSAPATDGLGPRIYQLFGGRLLADLTAVDGGADWLRVTGFVTRPDRPQPARASIRLFVNGRPVRDRALSRAVIEAYRKVGVADPRPEAFLFLETPLHLVDVNVHPAKTEVRFADTRVAWVAVEGAVRDALSAGARAAAPRAATEGVTAAVERDLAAARLPFAPPAWDARGGLVREPTGAASFALSPADLTPAVVDSTSADTLTVLGQHRLTYIVATDGEELLLVDQHTAHERVRFETLVRQLESRSVESQLLLTPILVALPPRLLPLLESKADLLAELGFDVEGFGGGSARLRAVPAVLGTRDPGVELETILRDLLERESSDWIVSGDRERLIATVACHSAARAGEPLARESMTAILRDLAGTGHPTLCPHGRPTVVRIPKDDVTRWFGRKGWRRE